MQFMQCKLPQTWLFSTTWSKIKNIPYYVKLKVLFHSWNIQIDPSFTEYLNGPYWTDFLSWLTWFFHEVRKMSPK